MENMMIALSSQLQQLSTNQTKQLSNLDHLPVESKPICTQNLNYDLTNPGTNKSLTSTPGARQTCRQKLNESTLTNAYPTSTPGARQTCRQKLNRSTMTKDYPTSTPGARQTCRQKLSELKKPSTNNKRNNVFSVSVQVARFTANKDRQGGVNPKIKVLAKKPPITAKVRSHNEALEEFFVKHIEFYKKINESYKSSAIELELLPEHSEPNPSDEPCTQMATSSTGQRITINTQRPGLDGENILSIFHQNVDRISNKVERLNHLLSSLKPDLVVVTEHGQHANNIINTQLNGYTLVSAFGRVHNIKGGVAIYKSNKIENETTSLEMEHLSIPLVWTTLYDRCISASYNLIDITAEAIEVLHKVLDNIPTHSRIILIGDINIDILRPTRETIMFDEFLLSHNMTRLQLSATRVFQGHQSSIDAICTNAEIDESQVKILHTGISDYFGQLCYLPLSVESKKLLPPLIDIVVAKPKARPCYDEEALRLKKDFLKANERYCLSGSQEDKQTSTQLKKAYDLKLRPLRQEASAAHIDNAANKNKAVWEIINSERNHQHKDTISGFDFIVKNGDKIDNPIDIANHFNNYFSTIADETLKQNLCVNPTMQFVQNPPVGMPLTSMEPTSIEEISKVIDSLKTKSSFGLNEIS
ncbi:hypothetical protein J6590_031172 [Homalodisca vitripennis]|nr:hypothetical protein J6590_031172 [Homalodisca vitripennis]